MGTDINFKNHLGRTYGTRIGLPAFDPAAQAYFAATGITGATQQAAIDNLVKGLKTDGIWTKMKAVYPFVTDNRNLFSYTENFTNGVWTNTGSIVTVNTTTAPNGTLTADTIKEDSSTAQHRTYQFFNATSGTSYTASIFCKPGVGTRNIAILFGCGFGSDNRIVFNVNNGTIVLSAGASGTITDAGNGWYRCTASATASATVSSCLQYQLRDGTTEIYTGDNTSSLIIWGAQVEQSSTPTTYQPIATTQQAYIASQFKYNLVNPVDSDAAFRLVFNGGWTHSSNGATPNGTNGYADTKFIPTTNFNSLNDKCFGLYVGTNTNNGVEMGALSGGYVGDQIVARNTNLAASSNSNLDPSTSASTDSRGFWLSTRSSSLSGKYYKNSTSIITLGASVSQYNNSMFLGARRLTTSAEVFSDKRFQLALMGDGLTDTEAANLYTRVQAYQTALARQI
jgi:hypothetical protein